MAFFSKKESAFEELNRLIYELSIKYERVALEICDDIKNKVERDYNYKYITANAKGYLAKLIVDNCWDPLKYSSNKYYKKYHDDDNKLNQCGVELLALAIEYTGIAVEYGQITEEQLADEVFSFCESINISN